MYVPEQNKYYESRHVRFVENSSYKDIVKNTDNEKVETFEIVSEACENPETAPIENASLSESEGGSNEPPLKRKRGRPKKNQNNDGVYFTLNEELENVEIDHEKSDFAYHVLLAKIQNDPQTYREAVNSPEGSRWREAIDNELNALRNKQVYSIIEKAKVYDKNKKPNVLSSRWVFKRKVDESGNVKFKGRLVTRGYQDRNEYDLRETYAPVSRLSLVRAFLIIANKYRLCLKQLDIETAFLYGDLDEEIYLEIPEGVNVDCETKKNFLWKLEKSLYGLKISPKKWNDRFSKTMVRLGFVSHVFDPCLFVKRSQSEFILVLLYMDDILLASKNQNDLNRIRDSLRKEFTVKDLGDPKLFLGIKVERNMNENTIKLSQEKFIVSMLKRFGFEKTRPVSSPMQTNQVRNHERKNREEDEYTQELKSSSVPVTQYRGAIGSLLYLANATRPDISYATNALSRHQVNPTMLEWEMVKRVFQYLSGTRHYTLTFKAKECNMSGFSDASLTDCKNSLTTCGFVIRLFGDSVAWRTHKQGSVALSTCQAEYVAMSEASQKLMSLHSSIEFILDNPLYPMTLYCDNMSAKICASTSSGNRLRHMVERREHYVRECVDKNYLKVSWVCSKNQLADIFTKALPSQLHEKLTLIILNMLNY